MSVQSNKIVDGWFPSFLPFFIFLYFALFCCFFWNCLLHQPTRWSNFSCSFFFCWCSRFFGVSDFVVVTFCFFFCSLFFSQGVVTLVFYFFVLFLTFFGKLSLSLVPLVSATTCQPFVWLFIFLLQFHYEFWKTRQLVLY